VNQTDPDLRDRIAEALLTTRRADYADLGVKANHREHRFDARCALCTYDVDALADAVLAVLPAPTDRAAALREAADALGRMDYDTDSNDYGYDTYRDAWNGGVMDAAALLRRLAGEAQQDEGEPEEPLVHVGWWCWRGDNHGHLATMPCRSDNVPIHVPAEWADEMRAVIQRIEDGDDEEVEARQDPTQDGEALPSSTAPLAAGLPLIKGNCPACRRASLFLGTGGYPTCANADCTEPDAATTVLEQYANEAHPPQHAWRVETRDADEWAPGSHFAHRPAAVERYETANRVAPLWRDGTPVERRIVRETTTYTVEEPATPARPGQPDTDPETQP
jgi:hypothetical protein